MIALAFHLLRLHSAPRSMPIRPGFRGRVRSPLGLLELQLVRLRPLGRPYRTPPETNPLYWTRPVEASDLPKADNNWTQPIVASCFQLFEGYLAGRYRCLVYAEVTHASFEGPRYMNVWHGYNLAGVGTLFCGVEHEPTITNNICLCGSCSSQWRDWICPFVHFD